MIMINIQWIELPLAFLGVMLIIGIIGVALDK